MKTLLIVVAVALVLVVLLAIFLTTGTRDCVCGEPDCGGGCLGRGGDLTGTR